ncbi:Branched-chain amino acid transport system permease protein LivM (TC 3.A.1.4.1) [hydrothermal vent metagenome]|uniref:Branched-chain amino acid transport system permease protein LivM (TC 3.A.1.4.1) n=1 Tax=hydrothermal vent metagenome TaxID=652676 RepID=A0A3B0S6V4_9ZZZZ
MFWNPKTGIAAALLAVAVGPFVVKEYQLDILIFLMINIILVTSYRFNTLTGEWSLIHVVMMGVGGYASTLLAKMAGVPFWLSLPLAAIFTGFFAFVLSFPLFRMKAFYFLIGSFAAGEAIRLSWERFRVPFGGPKGIKRIPSPEFAGVDLTEPIYYYFLTATFMFACLWALYRLEKSHLGFTLHAIHWKDVLAESVGVNARLYRSIAFVVASFFAAIAGALLVHYIGIVTPTRFGLGFMLMVLVWTIVGGTGTFIGPIIGVIVLTVSDEAFRGLNEYRPLVYGFILIFTIRFLPNGLEELVPRVRAYLSSRRSARTEGAADRTNDL